MKNFFKKLFNLFRENRKTIEFITDNLKTDGKIDLSDVKQILSLYKEAGLIIDEKLEETVFTAGNIDTIEFNISMNLVLMDQTSWSCVIYAMCRVLMYNSKIVLTPQEIESIKAYAKEKKYWADGEGMTFKNGCIAIKEWMWINKKIKVSYVRESILGKAYREMRNELGYMAGVGSLMTEEYADDFKDDGIVNGEYTRKEEKKYGHCYTDYNNIENEVDNYPTKLGDRNLRTNGRYKEFIEHSYMYTHGYFLFAEGVVIEKPEELIEVEDISDVNNKFYKHLKPHLQKGYKPLFEDYSDPNFLKGGEVRALIDLAFIENKKRD